MHRTCLKSRGAISHQNHAQITCSLCPLIPELHTKPFDGDVNPPCKILITDIPSSSFTTSMSHYIYSAFHLPNPVGSASNIQSHLFLTIPAYEQSPVHHLSCQTCAIYSQSRHRFPLNYNPLQLYIPPKPRLTVSGMIHDQNPSMCVIPPPRIQPYHQCNQ